MTPLERDLPEEQPDPELERRLSAVQRIPARPEFREALKQRFVAGRLGEVSRGGVRWRPRIVWLLLAAAVVALVIIWSSQLGPRSEFSANSLRLLEPSGGRARIGSTEVVLDEHALRSIEAGARVETGAEPLVLRLDSRAVIEIGRDSALNFNALGAPETDGEIVLELGAGAVRILTSADFLPSRMTVRAPGAELRVAGTELGIDVLGSMGTCVCCTRGVVEVWSQREPEHVHRLEANGMALFPPGGDPPMFGSLKPDHAAPIVGLRRYLP